MSAFEYNDLFLLAQETGKYHVFSFDIEGSKKMDSKTRYDAQLKLIRLMKSIYAVIEEIKVGITALRYILPIKTTSSAKIKAVRGVPKTAEKTPAIPQ